MATTSDNNGYQLVSLQPVMQPTDESAQYQYPLDCAPVHGQHQFLKSITDCMHTANIIIVFETH